MKKTDVVIIGAGIAGITSSIYLKRANIDFVLLEPNSVGGKLAMLHNIENYPGFSSISGQELMSNLEKQMEHLGIKTTKESVQSILKSEYGFEVKTNVSSIQTRVVIVATGIVTKVDTIKGEKENVGKGVSYCATCDGNFFKDTDVAVYGNNDIALEESLYLANLASKVHLVVNHKELLGDSKMVELVSNSPKIDIYLNKRIKEIKADQFGVTSILLDDEKEIPVYGVFPYVGERNAFDFLSALKVNSTNGFINVDENKRTNIEGLFAIGDITNKKLRQLVTSASDGAIASSSVISYLKKL